MTRLVESRQHYYLEEEALLDLGEQLDLDTMAGTLEQVSLMEGIPALVSRTVHVVVLILTQMNTESGETNNEADAVTTPFVDAVTSKLKVQVKAMQEEVALMATKLQDSMTEAVTALQAQMEAIAEKTLEGMHVAVQGISESMVKLAEMSTNYCDALLHQPSQAGLPSIPRFPHLAPRLKAREGIKSRQILVDFDSGQGQAPFSDDSIAMLKGRFNGVLQGDEGVSGHKTRAVSRLRNGSVLMELDSEEVVTRFAEGAVHKQFLEKLHLAATIKPRLDQVLVQFILLSFQPDREADLHEMEEANNFKASGIVRAHWVKPAARRKPSQTCGHLILSFQSPQFTNNTLAHGLIIEHKKVYTKKCKQEPLRCLKCHGWGHIVDSCEAPKDICGTCALQHHTTMCTIGENPWCMLCKVSGHSSWDCCCPIFQQKCHELSEKIDDNSMPYFPTHKTWTQVMEPPWSALIPQNRA